MLFWDVILQKVYFCFFINVQEIATEPLIIILDCIQCQWVSQIISIKKFAKKLNQTIKNYINNECIAFDVLYNYLVKQLNNNNTQ